MKCGACWKTVRKTRHAYVCTGPGKLRRARVCGDCAALGVLLVFGADEAPGRKRERGAPRVLRAHDDVRASRGEPCGAVHRLGRRELVCNKTTGHAGAHAYVYGAES